MAWVDAVTSLAATGVSGPPPRTDLVFPALADTWSLTLSAEFSIGGDYFTELWIPGLPYRHRGQETDKSQASFFPVGVTDTWFIQWNESPFDTVQLDLWDTWQLVATDTSSVGINQSFPATEFWNITFNEVTSLSITNSLVTLTPNDQWQITEAPEAATLFKDIANPFDTWSVTYGTESSSLVAAVTTSADTWSITFSAETSAVVTGGAFNVATVDSWSLTAADASQVLQTQFTAVSDIWTLTAADSSQVATSGTMALSDTWSLMCQEAPIDIQATPMSSDLVDTWRIGTLSEISSLSNVPTIPILTSDQWTLTLVESVTLLTNLARPPTGRRIKAPAKRRVELVDE